MPTAHTAGFQMLTGLKATTIDNLSGQLDKSSVRTAWVGFPSVQGGRVGKPAMTGVISHHVSDQRRVEIRDGSGPTRPTGALDCEARPISCPTSTSSPHEPAPPQPPLSAAGK